MLRPALAIAFTLGLTYSIAGGSGTLSAQTTFPKTFDVTATGATSFPDQYVFAEGTGSMLQTGTFTTGGVVAPNGVTKYVLQPKQKTVTRYRLVFTNGRPKFTPETVTVTYNAYVPTTVAFISPAVEGTWHAFNFDTFSWWSFQQYDASGFAFGYGSTYGEKLRGVAVYINFRDVPTGAYALEGAPPVTE